MAKYEIKYKEIIGNTNKYQEKTSMLIADNEKEAKERFFDGFALRGYDGIRRPRIWILDIKEIVEEDATQAGGIVGPTSIFGSKSNNNVDDVYMQLLNLDDYKN